MEKGSHIYPFFFFATDTGLKTPFWGKLVSSVLNSFTFFLPWLSKSRVEPDFTGSDNGTPFIFSREWRFPTNHINKRTERKTSQKISLNIPIWERDFKELNSRYKNYPRKFLFLGSVKISLNKLPSKRSNLHMALGVLKSSRVSLCDPTGLRTLMWDIWPHLSFPFLPCYSLPRNKKLSSCTLEVWQKKALHSTLPGLYLWESLNEKTSCN